MVEWQWITMKLIFKKDNRIKRKKKERSKSIEMAFEWELNGLWFWIPHWWTRFKKQSWMETQIALLLHLVSNIDKTFATKSKVKGYHLYPSLQLDFTLNISMALILNSLHYLQSSNYVDIFFVIQLSWNQHERLESELYNQSALEWLINLIGCFVLLCLHGWLLLLLLLFLLLSINLQSTMVHSSFNNPQ